MTLTEARERIGEEVIYRAHGAIAEDGTISSVGERFVFVRYAGDRHSKATDPAALTLLAGAA
jgi:hypothetical protein